MIPPSDVEHPTLVVEQDTHVGLYSQVQFQGYTVKYQKTYLKFNDHPGTAVVVKKIGNKVYAVLVRDHLLLEPKGVRARCKNVK